MKRGQKLFVAVVLGLTMAMAAAADNNNHGKVVAPGEEYKGKSYNELVSKWANWLATEPIATNPAFDPDGRYCGLNQDGKVWFLASTFSGVADRTCEIPGGKALFISLGGVFLSFAPDFPAPGDSCLQMSTSVERVRCDVAKGVPVAPDVKFEASLDGQPITDLFAYRAQSVPGGFTMRIPNPSLLTDFGLTPGDRTPAVADGYFLLIKPLHHGTHTLSVKMINPDLSERGVNYTLIVGDGNDD